METGAKVAIVIASVVVVGGGIGLAVYLGKKPKTGAKPVVAAPPAAKPAVAAAAPSAPKPTLAQDIALGSTALGALTGLFGAYNTYQSNNQDGFDGSGKMVGLQKI